MWGILAFQACVGLGPQGVLPKAETDADDLDGAEDIGGVEPLPDTGAPDDTATEPEEEPGDPVDGAEVLFAEGVIHDIGIELDDEAWDAMAADEDAVVHADVSIDGEVFADCGVRRKGSSTGRNLDAKAAFVVDLAEFVPDQRFHGLRHFALNNMVMDPSMVREHVASWWYAQRGVPAFRHGFARVEVNGDRYGLYGVLQSMDQRFLDEHWGWDRTGWMYEGIFNWGDLTPAMERYFTVAEEGDEGEPFADLHELVEVVGETSAGEVMEMLEEHFDAEAFLRGQAAEIGTHNWDGYWSNRNNFLLYHAPRSGRWYMVPWGQDQSFTSSSNPLNGYDGLLMAMCAADGDCMDRLYDHLVEAAQAMREVDLEGYAHQTFALIEEECEHDPRRELPCDPSTLFAFVEERPEDMLDYLGWSAR